MRACLAIALVVIGCGTTRAEDLFGPGMNSSGGAGGMYAGAGGGAAGSIGGVTGNAGSAGLTEGGTAGNGGTSNGGSSGSSGNGGTSGKSGSGGVESGGADSGGNDSGGADSGGAGQAGAPAAGGAGGADSGGQAGSETSGGAGGEGGGPACSGQGDERCDGIDNDCAGGIDDGDVCPDGCYGFASDDGHGYMICMSGLGFVDARAACQIHHSSFDLAKIESQDENNFLVAKAVTLTASATDFWIGATDSADILEGAAENAWFWLDGTQFYDDLTHMPVGGAYENWADNRPNNLGAEPGEDCGALVVNENGLHAQWNDLQCDDGAPYICEAAAD